MPGQIDFGGTGSGPHGGIAEYQEIDLQCGGFVPGSRFCVSTDCGIAEFMDIDWPPGTIVGPEFAAQVFVGDCCASGSGHTGDCGTVQTQFCQEKLPSSFAVSFLVVGCPFGGTYTVTWNAGTQRYEAPANSLGVNSTFYIDNFGNLFIVCNGVTYAPAIALTITQCCPLTAHGFMAAPGNPPLACCTGNWSITATINDSTTGGTSPTAYVVYYRDILIPEQFVKLGAKYCIENPLDCCLGPVTCSQCPAQTYPPTLYTTVINANLVSHASPPCTVPSVLTIPMVYGNWTLGAAPRYWAGYYVACQKEETVLGNHQRTDCIVAAHFICMDNESSTYWNNYILNHPGSPTTCGTTPTAPRFMLILTFHELVETDAGSGFDPRFDLGGHEGEIFIEAAGTEVAWGKLCIYICRQEDGTLLFAGDITTFVSVGGATICWDASANPVVHAVVTD